MHSLIKKFYFKVFNKSNYILAILLTSLGPLHAETLAYSTLKIYHQLTPLKSTQWQILRRNPLAKQSFFVHDNLGSIHLLKDNTLSTEPLIDLKKYFPNIHTATGISLHPSFNIQQNYGYLTLYSAHTEPTDTIKPTVRIQENNNITQKFEVVINEWQFDNDKLTPFNLKTKQPREVLRLPISSPDMGIMQLQFNPYVKPWNENYGELYFTLRPDPNKPNSALYSGSVLRINPEKFGFNSYTTPKSNPFINSDDIANEVIATGLNNLLEIHWSKGGSKKLLITHSNKQNFSASTINYGEDFRKKKSKSTDFTAPFPQQSNSIIYRGMKFAKFRNNVFYLTWDKNWKLIAIANTPPYRASTLAIFNDIELPQNKALVLLTDEDDELLIFDKSQQVIFAINPPKKPISYAKIQAQQASENNIPQQNNPILYWLLLFLTVSACFIMFRRNKKLSLPKALLRKQFAKFSIESTKNQISIYKRHEDIASVALNISDVIHSDILLNNELIYSFNSENIQDCFSAQKEQAINLSFSNEKRDKMVDEKVRKIELLLTDKTLKNYPICVYLRKGNQRLTKCNYDEICQQLIDWCWVLSQAIFPDKTENRTIIQPITSTTSKRKKIEKNNTGENHTSNITVNKESTVKETNNIQNEPSETIDQRQKDETEGDKQQREISLINALDKLGQLKQQGLLSEEEFNDAKARVLKNLNNSD